MSELRRRMIMQQARGGLPSEYQEVAFLENTSTSRINTGVIFQSGDYPTIRAKFSLTQRNKRYESIIGGYYTNNLSTGVGIVFNDTTLYGYILNNGWHIVNIASQYQLGEWFDVVYNSPNGTIVNDQYIDSNYYSLDMTGDIFPIFTRKPGGHSLEAEVFKGRISCFSLYKNGKIIRDFIPCYRKSDNEPGMYDIVNDVFYTNAGSGTFVVGPDVN